ncbi:hypothetical protein DDZ18_03030 [Marinicauda salina]|uniref:AAA domain-containing protein n=1 Tax=Marinicauda salina TaxID=2135793 RepID=A0A2U2BX56_9PROT|nr:AAA family ATPase [Marinicauda salina]PWE18592.1 hypothetical protein DDZ18_03030 [Marinicauda salina]
MTIPMKSLSPEKKKAAQRSLRAWVCGEDTARQIETVAKDIPDLKAVLEREDDPLAAASSHSASGADIALVELPETTEETLRQVELLAKAWRDDASFIVMLRDPTTETVRRLFRAGISDVLPVPCSDAELAPTLMHASESLDAKGGRRGAGRVVTVLKSAGGVGASTMAANLAGEFHRQTEGRVALVDLDVQFGDLALYLDIKPRRTLLEALQAGSRLDETLLASLMERHKSGIELMAGPPFITPLDRVTDGFLSTLIRLLKNEFSVVVLELPSGWSDWFSTVFEQSDMLAMICEPTVRSASGLKRVIQCLGDLSFDDAPNCLIANKVREGSDSRERVNQLKTTLKRPIETIRYDEQAAGRATDTGVLLAETGANSHAYRDLQGVASKILTQLDLPVRAADPREQQGFKLPFIGRLT